MKYISFAIPCYNSEAYMEKAINSILVGGEDVEIIVVNDGSKDGTQAIAERYQEKYPTIVKAVSKENGGHGDAVNWGLRHATGKYFKVVDSDDWVDEESLHKILEAVKNFVEAETEVDMIIANYVYEKVGMEHKKVIRYDNVLPPDLPLGRHRPVPSGSVHPHALRHLPHGNAETVPAQSAEAYVLVDSYFVYYSLPSCAHCIT